MNNPSGKRRMHYIIWLCVAALVIAAGFAYCWLTERSFHAWIRQALREQKQAGTLPAEWKDIDPEHFDISKLGDMQMKVPRGMETRLQLALLLTDRWYIWVPLVVACCLAIAKLTARPVDDAV